MKKLFTADRYTPTEFYTAEDKAAFANQFVRFVESDFKGTLFTKKFYNRLSNTFGHIAHFNQAGFYAAQFGDTTEKFFFLKRTAEWQSYGSPSFTYCDVERDLAQWVSDTGLIEKYRAKIQADNEAAERATLARLQAKYPEGAKS